jgi:hypothetical protein
MVSSVHGRGKLSIDLVLMTSLLTPCHRKRYPGSSGISLSSSFDGPAPHILSPTRVINAEVRQPKLDHGMCCLAFLYSDRSHTLSFLKSEPR